MKVSYNWIKELAPVDWSPEEMAHRLTLAGTACENMVDLAAKYEKMIVGEVVAVEAIKGADKVMLAKVETGSGVLTALCGAPNVAAGQKAPVALEGAVMPDGLKIGSMKRFGVESQCMIASERELELSDDHSGIMVLPSDAVVGMPLAEALGLCDYSLEFELTPNRADSMSALGIARDVAALAGVSLQRPEFTVSEGVEKTTDQLKVEIDDPQFCPRYIGRIIKNVTIGPSPAWMRNRLLASGLTPINNIVDITNYVMLEYGQPLHAFDLAHFPTGKVVVRRAKAGEFTTLDGVERSVDESVLMITNGAEDLATGGVMGGLKSSITDETRDVLLEGANFDPALIRKSRLKLGLQTDASQRFEKGVDPNITREAIDRATQLLVELAGGTALAGAADNYARRIEPLTIDLRVARLNEILGTELTRERAAEILSGLELGVETAEPEVLRVTAPTFRPDLEREIDLIEEVARIIGFDNIPTTTGYLELYPADREEMVLREKTVEEIRRTALACGFDEICGSGLADERALEALDPGAPQVRLANPISDEFSSLRNSLAYSLLAAARTNVTHQVTAARLFELGKVYAPRLDGEFHERERLGLLVTGEAEAFWRGGRGAPLDYYWLKGALERISSGAGLRAVEIRPQDSPAFETGHSFELRLNDAMVGRLGVVKASIAKSFDIKQPVALAELDLESALGARLPEPEYQPIPRYPASLRDLALVVGEEALVGDILSAVRELGGGLVEAVSVFDLFRGKQVPAGRKSVAISIRYRSSEKSLESTEVDSLQRKIIDYLKREFKADIRDQ